MKKNDIIVDKEKYFQICKAVQSLMIILLDLVCCLKCTGEINVKLTVSLTINCNYAKLVLLTRSLANRGLSFTFFLLPLTLNVSKSKPYFPLQIKPP